MSTADHRDEALHCLDAVDVLRDNDVDGSLAHAALASEATAHALLAIEGRLGEIAEQQRVANVIAGYQLPAVHNTDAEYLAARAAVRQVLGLPEWKITGYQSPTQEGENR